MTESTVSVNSLASTASINLQESSSATDKRCIICAENASTKIIKDDNFIKMMTCYWEGLEIDVKPKRNNDFDLCVQCFYNLKQLYETKDILSYFATNVVVQQGEILRKNLQGIAKRITDSTPLLDVHKIMQEKEVREPPELDQGALRGYKVNTYTAEEQLSSTVIDKPREEKGSTQIAEKRLRISSAINIENVIRPSQRKSLFSKKAKIKLPTMKRQIIQRSAKSKEPEKESALSTSSSSDTSTEGSCSDSDFEISS